MGGQEGEPRGSQDRVDQLRRMHGEAARPDGIRLLLRRVARQAGGHAALLDGTGQLADGFPEEPADFLSGIADDIERLREGRTRSISVHDDLRTVTALMIGEGRHSPVLVVAGDEARLQDSGWLLADAARLLWLCWQVETSRRSRQRVDRADGAAREAVLHLLMLGQRDSARRVAAALRSSLPESLRVSVVESRRPSRDELAARLADMTGGRAFVVPCPVYSGHLIVLVPEARPDEPGQEAASVDLRLRELVRSSRHGGESETLSVGTSQVVSLREVSTAYAQAFHALARARNTPDRYASFSAREDLAAVLGDTGLRWASGFLSPLTEYVPERPQDPDADELRVTLGSWLSFHHRAASQLKIHRNTLAARLTKIEHILACDVHDVGTQARLDLALRLAEGGPHQAPGKHANDLDLLLDRPSADDWAKRQLSPLLEDNPRLVATVRVWLEKNTRLDATATKLGISVPAVRKRLVRVEAALERSVLHGPSVRYDLYFALRIRDGAQPS